MKLILVESPLAGDTELNVRYARMCLHHALKNGEAPFASHLLYAQPGILDDTIPEERQLGITAGLLWGTKADLTAVYLDLGVSSGMQLGIEAAVAKGRRFEFRRLHVCAGCLKKLAKDLRNPAARSMYPHQDKVFCSEVCRTPRAAASFIVHPSHYPPDFDELPE